MWNYVAERVEAVAGLQKQIEELTCSRSIEVSRALAVQTEEIDFLKAELTSAKVRLHDALSQSQAEKDALIRHADASRTELLQQLEELRRVDVRVDETERQTSVDYSESPRGSSSRSGEAPGNEHMPGMEGVTHVVDSSASLWQKLELLRGLVLAEKDKWNLQQADVFGQELDVDTPDGTVSEAAVCSHKIRSSWVVLEEQVLPLIETFCTTAVRHSGPTNREAEINVGCVLENQENADGHREAIEHEKTLRSVREQLEEEKREVIRLKEVVSVMCVKDEAVREMEIKCDELQTQLESAHEQLRSQEELAENLSAKVESANEQLQQQAAELSEKDVNIQKLNAELAEMRRQLLVLQTDCDEKLNTERKTWQSQVNSKADELLAKCAELEQCESTIKALSDQCTMLTSERDAKTAEIINNNAQIDSLSREISVVKEYLNAKTVELLETQTCVEHERKLLKDETESGMHLMKCKVIALEDEISTLREQLESKTVELINKDEALISLQYGSVSERERLEKLNTELQTKIAGLEDQLQSSQQSFVEKFDSLTKAVTAKESAIRELEETHAAHCSETESEMQTVKSQVAALEDEVSTFREQLESKTVELVNKDEVLTSLRHETVSERERLEKLNTELLAKIAGLEDQLHSDQKSSVEKFDSLTKAVTAKESAIRELEETHAAHCSETESEMQITKSKVTSLEDEISTLREQLESKTVELTNKDEALILLEQRTVGERDELQAKIAGLESQLHSDQKSSMEQLDTLTELVTVKESAIRELEETHAAYCGKTDAEMQTMKSKVTALEDEISTLQQQLHSKTVELVSKDKALTSLEHRNITEQEELQAKVAGLESQLCSDQTSSVEQLDSLTKEVSLKEAVIRELEEAHAAYCKLTDTKLTELSAAVTVKEDDIKSLVEQHKAELVEKSETFNEEMAKLTSAHEEQLSHLNSQISDLIKNTEDLESQVKVLKDKLGSESENVDGLETNVTELSMVKEECERQLEDMRSTLTGETEQMIKQHDEEKTALKSALSERDHSLSLLHAALSQTCHEDVQSVDSSSRTVVTSGSEEAEVLDAGSGDAGRVTSEQSVCEQNYDVPMMVHQINSLSAANAVLQDKIGRLEADLQQMRQTSMKPVDESPQHNLALTSQPHSSLCSSG